MHCRSVARQGLSEGSSASEQEGYFGDGTEILDLGRSDFSPTSCTPKLLEPLFELSFKSLWNDFKNGEI